MEFPKFSRFSVPRRQIQMEHGTWNEPVELLEHAQMTRMLLPSLMASTHEITNERKKLPGTRFVFLFHSGESRKRSSTSFRMVARSTTEGKEKRGSENPYSFSLLTHDSSLLVSPERFFAACLFTQVGPELYLYLVGLSGSQLVHGRASVG